MNFRALAARFALVVSCGLLTATPAMAQFWQCAPYAREISGIQIRGNANTWWGQAAGKHARGKAPKVGAVLAFQSTARMRVGHVAMVSRIVDDREVLLTHANWSRRGGIERDVRAVDVSAAGDWSVVKVWYAPQGGLGTSSYPTNGFIYSDQAPAQTPAVQDEAQLPTLYYASSNPISVKGTLTGFAPLAR
ncbi:CHAP domain-containing protein [Sphingomonas sp. SUN019]|uniref:CHAP domain-containing protein n=1 Tax=Sphingomonas sp. SUN019 TaxID=2937788 RepID=UPI00216474BD|nr:CHAP domain-containing protein [Sphingomonas sp. SUN019]UVO51499.1 CHAP domain-containing protein [Sphingomonas sp. SUN019]